jgi:hypothetical protein
LISRPECGGLGLRLWVGNPRWQVGVAGGSVRSFAMKASSSVVEGFGARSMMDRKLELSLLVPVRVTVHLSRKDHGSAMMT